MPLPKVSLNVALAEYNRVVDHALTLGLEASGFLRAWREGDWSACREFGFEPVSWMLDASTAPNAPVHEDAPATCKQSLQVWVIPDGKGAGQFSWEPQDERFWTRMGPVVDTSTKR